MKLYQKLMTSYMNLKIYHNTNAKSIKKINKISKR